MVQTTLPISIDRLVRRFRQELRRDAPRPRTTEGPSQGEKTARRRNSQRIGTLSLRLLVQHRTRRQTNSQRIRQREAITQRKTLWYHEAKPRRQRGTLTPSRRNASIKKEQSGGLTYWR